MFDWFLLQWASFYGNTNKQPILWSTFIHHIGTTFCNIPTTFVISTTPCNEDGISYFFCFFMVVGGNQIVSFLNVLFIFIIFKPVLTQIFNRIHYWFLHNFPWDCRLNLQWEK